MHWLRTLSLLILTLLLLWFAPPPVQATEAWLPTATYDGAPVLNFGQMSFSNLPVLQEAGEIAVPNEFVDQLAWNPARTWDAQTPLANVLQLGDVSEAFGLERLNLGQIAQVANLDLNRLSLSNLQLLQKQTIASLVKAIPGLGNLPLNQVKPLLELVNLNLPSASWSLANQAIGATAADDLLGSLSFNTLNLDQFSFTSIPGLEQVPLSNFNGWQGSAIAGIPGLDKLPFAQFPINPFQILGLVAIHDVTYGGDGAHKESRQTPTKFSITGSDKVGFNYNCHQAKGCDYIELNAPGYAGLGGMSDPGGLHGARWIRGGKGDGEQMVPGGKGILGKLNDGMEPTGRLSFGKAFKVVLIHTDESSGTGQFGLYFRVCIKKAFVDLGCTPYFIGPIPWLSTHEKGLVFVGLADGTGGIDELPSDAQLPTDIQDQIDQINQDNGAGGSDSDNSSDLCGSGPAGVDFKALADATSSIEGNYGSVGQWGCDGAGNCGRGLGRYQFMTYRADVRQAILGQPGGSAFYRQLAAGHQPSSAELLRYFGSNLQDSLFVKAQTQNINVLQRQGKSGNELIACLGEMWYSGECRHSNARDYTGGPTVREYGQILVGNYQRALKRSGATPCVTTGTKGNTTSQGSGKASGKLSSPATNAPVTSEFGPRARPCTGCSAYHLGLDFGVPDGTPVKAADGGRVIYSGWMQGYGNTLVIDHGNGLMTLYAHNSQLLAKVGDSVSGGQVVTRSGHSGVGTGAHLHFTVIEGASPGNIHSGHEVDPRKYLKL